MLHVDFIEMKKWALTTFLKNIMLGYAIMSLICLYETFFFTKIDEMNSSELVGYKIMLRNVCA